MKRINLYVTILLMCLMCMGTMIVKAENITLTQAGTLYEKIGSRLQTISTLTITGPVNGSDIATIREMEALLTLDMVNANIVTGGDPYYMNYTTENDVIGTKMFFGLSQLKKLILPKTVKYIGSMDANYEDIYGEDDANNDNRGCLSIGRCTSLEEIVLPESLLKIRAKAFYNCIKLKAIVIPEGTTTMGSWTFYKCQSLTSVSIPSTYTAASIGIDDNGEQGVDDIGYNFYGCQSINNVTIAEGCVALAPQMFKDCSGITSVQLPNSLINLNEAFYGCSSLQALNLPASCIKGVGIAGCQSITSFVVPEGVTSLCSMSNCTALKNITLPESVTSIFRFSYCKSLEQITLPQNIIEIPEEAFMGCEQLKAFTIPEKVKVIGRSAFNGCTSMTEISIPSGVNLIDAGAFSNCRSLARIELPRVTELAEGTFQGCVALQDVKFPRNLTVIKAEAFKGCTSLETIALPSLLFNIEYGAFSNCKIKELIISEGISKLNNGIFSGSFIGSVSFPTSMDCITGFQYTNIRQVNIPEGPTKIGTEAFRNCYTMNSLALPASIDSIGDRAFMNCDSLNHVIIPDGVLSIGKQAFSCCDTLEIIELPSTLTELKAAFPYSKLLKTIIIPDGIDSIAAGTFYACPNLTEVILPTTVKRIGGGSTGLLSTPFSSPGYEERVNCFGAFAYCDNLTAINMENITELGAYAFASSGLKAISLPKIAEIEEGAFEGSEKIVTANLPEALLIGASAFYECHNLEEIQLPMAKNIGENAFYSTGLKSVVLPSVTSIGAKAFFYNNLSFVSLPTGLTTIGDQCFYSNYSHTISIVEWNAPIEIPANTFSSVRYLFIPDGITGNNANATYIIRNGIADTFTAETIGREDEDNKWIEVYEIPKAFKAKKATYSRRFTQTSGVGEAAGWETIVLPFDAEKFIYTGYSYDSGENIPLAPFGSEALQIEGTRPFWLYEMTTEGPKAAMTIEAHKPYLICMPNNNKYPNSSNISGNVNFIGENETNGVLISETEGKLQTAKGKDYNLVPTYQTVQQSESVYQLNIDNWYDEYKPGSVFVKNGGSIQPFYAYATPASAQAAQAPFFSIGFGDGGITGLEEELLMTPDKAVKATSNNGILSIESNKSRIINLYDAAGRTTRTLELQEGTNTVTDLEDGIYFLEGQKVLINH